MSGNVPGSPGDQTTCPPSPSPPHPQTSDGALAPLVCLLDPRGRIVWVNPAIERWALVLVPDACGQNLHELLHPACRATTCILAAALATCCRHVQQGDSSEVSLCGSIRHRRAQFYGRLLQSSAAAKSWAAFMAMDVTAGPIEQGALRTALLDLASACTNLEVLTRANQRFERELISPQLSFEALEPSREELASLSRELLAEQELERKGLARTLRERLVQSLCAVKYALERGAELARASPAPDLQQLLRRTIVEVQDVIEESRAFATKLRPSTLDDFGAVSAIRALCCEFARAHPLIELRKDISILDAAVPEQLRTTLFRCVQQLLYEVDRHGQSCNVVVSLSRTADRLTLEVLEDGVAMSVMEREPLRHTTHALLAAKQQAEMTGGRLVLIHDAGISGLRTRIEWLVPASGTS